MSVKRKKTKRKYCPSCGRKLFKGKCRHCGWEAGHPIWGYPNGIW